MNDPSPSDWTLVAAAFDAALALPPTERRACVARGLPSRPDLVDHTLQLVELASTPHTVLDRDAAALLCAHPPPIEDLTGSSVGRYTIVERLSSGGMGDVYLAEHGERPVVRRVAIKVLRRGLDSQAVLARCAVERRVLAALHHPSIVAFLDAGALLDGRPYLVMEHVDGRAITTDVRARGLAARARMTLFLDVCRAVAHAHAHLVLHRDIKPSNVFVAHNGAVKLLDFGVAKLLSPGDADATTLPLPTTARYAAPELLTHRPATVATDVHALGLLLFELLTDEPARGDDADPFAALDSPSSRRAARPQPPSPLLRAADLDAIVARATALEPLDRYPSVESFARDLERHLLDEPIDARRSSSTDTLRRTLRRHRASLLVGAATLVLLLALLVGAHLGRVRAERDASRGWTAHSTSKSAALFLTELLTTATLTPAFFEHAAALAADLRTDPETQALVDLAVGRAALAAAQPALAIPHLERALALSRTPPLGPRDELSALHHLARAHAALASPAAEVEFVAALQLIESHPALVASRALVTLDFAAYLATLPSRTAEALQIARDLAADLGLLDAPTELAPLLTALRGKLP